MPTLLDFKHALSSQVQIFFYYPFKRKSVKLQPSACTVHSPIKCASTTTANTFAQSEPTTTGFQSLDYITGVSCI